jgi:serine/threonine protein kinase
MTLSNAEVARLAELVDTPDLPGDRYRILERIGEGGMGSVYLAHDLPLDRRVAIKVLHSSREGDELGRRLEREARTIAALDHASVVPIHETGVLADGRRYYVMKYVAGATLRAWRESARSDNELLRTFLRCCEAVAHAHSLGVIHRDLKPDNVMVGPHGELYVVDWGLARRANDAESASATGGVREHGTEHGTILGSRGYMAPEQARGEIRAVGPPADVHALGGMLAFLWSGADPSSEGPLELERAPRPLRSIVRKARAEDPAERYPTALELAADVAHFLDREPVSAHRESALERAGRFLDRNRFVAWLVVGYVTLRALVFLFAGR